MQKSPTWTKIKVRSMHLHVFSLVQSTSSATGMSYKPLSDSSQSYATSQYGMMLNKWQMNFHSSALASFPLHKGVSSLKTWCILNLYCISDSTQQSPHLTHREGKQMSQLYGTSYLMSLSSCMARKWDCHPTPPQLILRCQWKVRIQ